MNNKKIMFALTGCGKIGARHAEQMNRLGKIVAVCDIDASKAHAFAKKHQCNSYLQLNELLAHETNIDVMAICTPNGLHASQSIACLQAGNHVVCEKPMAISSKDCSSMIQVAAANNRHLFLVKQNRFNAPVIALQKAIAAGWLGRLYSFQVNCFWNRNDDYYKDNWHGKKDMDGGTLFTQFSHFIDIVYWLFGDVKKAHAFLSNQAHKQTIEFEDTGAVILQLQNNITGTLNYTVNSYNENMEGSLTLFAEKGTVKIGGQYLNKIEYQNIQDHVLNEIATTAKANDYGLYKGSMSNHDKVYNNVIDVLHNNAAISTSAHEGLKTVEIIEKIYASFEE